MKKGIFFEGQLIAIIKENDIQIDITVKDKIQIIDLE